MIGVSALTFNGYRLDTRNGRRFDATLLNFKDTVPEGQYELDDGSATTSFLQPPAQSVERVYALKPVLLKNVTPRYHLVSSKHAKFLGICADGALLQSSECNGQYLRVQYSAPWMLTARAEMGQHEVAGASANPRILEYFKSAGFTQGKDDTGEKNAWCASFVSWVMEKNGYTPPENAFRARMWAKFGTVITNPVYGAIGVKSRKGGGHTAFVLGQSGDGKFLYMLGGNQNDQVSIARYPRADWTTFVYPSDLSASAESLPVYKGSSKAAGSEA